MNTTNKVNKKTTHKLYWIHASMLNRCYTSTATSYPRYGAKGIKVCKRWRGVNGFENFIADMGERPTQYHQIDRIDSRGDYEPENCRWATAKENSMNRRSTRWVEYNGKTKTISDWARKYGLKVRTLNRRLNTYKWSIDQALTTPVVKGGTKLNLKKETK